MVLSINIIKGICSKKGKFPRICQFLHHFSQVADKTAVTGARYRITDECQCLSRKICGGTGQPRYDSMITLGQCWYQDQFKKEWNIDPENKIITCAFAWSTYSKLEVELNLNTLFDTIYRFFNDSVLIIKPHTGDKKEHIRLFIKNYHKAILPSVYYPRDYHTLALLYVSDL